MARAGRQQLLDVFQQPCPDLFTAGFECQVSSRAKQNSPAPKLGAGLSRAYRYRRSQNDRLIVIVDAEDAAGRVHHNKLIEGKLSELLGNIQIGNHSNVVKGAVLTRE